MSDIISGISKYANSGELNFKIENKQDAMEALKAEYLYYMLKKPFFRNRYRY